MTNLCLFGYQFVLPIVVDMAIVRGHESSTFICFEHSCISIPLGHLALPYYILNLFIFNNILI